MVKRRPGGLLGDPDDHVAVALARPAHGPEPGDDGETGDTSANRLQSTRHGTRWWRWREGAEPVGEVTEFRLTRGPPSASTMPKRRRTLRDRF
jgi:hypothetical protein